MKSYILFSSIQNDGWYIFNNSNKLAYDMILLLSSYLATYNYLCLTRGLVVYVVDVFKCCGI